MNRRAVSLTAIRHMGAVAGYSIEGGRKPGADIIVRDADLTAVGHPSIVRAIGSLEPRRAAAILRLHGFAAWTRATRAPATLTVPPPFEMKPANA